MGVFGLISYMISVVFNFKINFGDMTISMRQLALLPVFMSMVGLVLLRVSSGYGSGTRVISSSLRRKK